MEEATAPKLHKKDRLQLHMGTKIILFWINVLWSVERKITVWP
jgi:hypothetical protein